MSCKHIFSSCLASLAPRRSRMWKEGKKVHERTAAVEVFYVLWSILKASEAPLFYERGTQPLNTPYDALREILHRCRLASKLRLAVDWARCLFFLTFGSNPKIQGAKISFEAKKSLLSTLYKCDNCWWWQDDLAILPFSLCLKITKNVSFSSLRQYLLYFQMFQYSRLNVFCHVKKVEKCEQLLDK